ncbi:hypothetical protein PanWU01x14_085520, partial [Parasponia andersonii]
FSLSDLVSEPSSSSVTMAEVKNTISRDTDLNVQTLLAATKSLELKLYAKFDEFLWDLHQVLIQLLTLTTDVPVALRDLHPRARGVLETPFDPCLGRNRDREFVRPLPATDRGQCFLQRPIYGDYGIDLGDYGIDLGDSESEEEVAPWDFG